MPDEATPTTSEGNAAKGRALGGITFVAAAITFLTGGVMVFWADPPPSGAPVLGMLSHGLWALSITLLAIGAVILTRSARAIEISVSSTLAVGSLGLGVVVGLQWVTWAYVDLRAARQDQYELFVETILTPFGAGHVLMYGVLLGAGVAFLGWALVHSLGYKYAGWAGFVAGTLTVLAAAVSILSALEGGGDGHWLYNAATLLLPVCYLWAMVTGIILYLRRQGA